MPALAPWTSRRLFAAAWDHSYPGFFELACDSQVRSAQLSNQRFAIASVSKKLFPGGLLFAQPALSFPVATEKK
jgi:hypothetical protein